MTWTISYSSLFAYAIIIISFCFRSSVLYPSTYSFYLRLVLSNVITLFITLVVYALAIAHLTTIQCALCILATTALIFVVVVRVCCQQDCL